MAPTVAARLCFFVLASLFAGHSEEALRHCTAIETSGSGRNFPFAQTRHRVAV
jgi:hypothetical protein